MREEIEVEVKMFAESLRLWHVRLIARGHDIHRVGGSARVFYEASEVRAELCERRGTERRTLLSFPCSA